MSNRTTRRETLAEDARWPRDRPPSGHIMCNGRPMAYWLPRGVTVDVVNVISDSHPAEVDSAGRPVAGGQPKGNEE